MERVDPFLDMGLAHTHPDPVSIGEEAHRPELAFVLGAFLRDHSDYRVHYVLWSSSLALSLIIYVSKTLDENGVQHGKLPRTPTISPWSLAFGHEL